MKAMLALELKKAFKNKLFIVSILIMSIFAALSAAYLIENNYDFNPVAIEGYFMRDGEWFRNPLLSVTGFFNSWLGNEGMSLMHSLFFSLSPVFAALPFAWSLSSEIKSGYIKNVVSRTVKINYFAAKAVATFFTGALAMLIPLIINVLLVSAFVPVYMPEVEYEIYNHIFFGDLWADLFYTNPFLHTALYIALMTCFGGIFAIFSLGLTFYVNNRFAVVLLPFLLFLGLTYAGNTLSSQFPYWSFQIVPTAIIQPGTSGLSIVGWIVAFEAAIILAFAILSISLKGVRHEVI